MLEILIGAVLGVAISLLKELYLSRKNRAGRNRFGRIGRKNFFLGRSNAKKKRLIRRLIPINIELSDGKRIQYEVPTMNTLIFMLESHEGISMTDSELLIPRILEIREFNQLMILNGPKDYIRKTIIGCAQHNAEMIIIEIGRGLAAVRGLVDKPSSLTKAQL